MAPHHVLLLGGSGRIAQLLTPMLLQQSWSVTSIIRNPDQVAGLQKLGEGVPGKLDVLVRSVEDVTSEAQARDLIDQVKADYVVWSAGAGGKGPPERTFTVDRDAASHFIRASAAAPSVTKFIMVSFLGSRLAKPSWWDDEQWEISKQHGPLQRYYEAKVAADEVLYKEGRKREKTGGGGGGGGSFAAICLRPGTLTAEPEGPVQLGKTPKSRGNVSRASVARVATLLLQSPDVKSRWLDLLDGPQDPAQAVDQCVRDDVDCAQDEPYYEA